MLKYLKVSVNLLLFSEFWRFQRNLVDFCVVFGAFCGLFFLAHLHEIPDNGCLFAGAVGFGCMRLLRCFS